MAKSHSTVQAAQTESHQDIEYSDESIDGLRRLLFPEYENLYTGPGSYTARELQEALGLGTHERARYRARKAVLAGEMVEVRVLRTKGNGAEYIAAGWVQRDVYDEWIKSGGEE
jgi:hypothetical protein